MAIPSPSELLERWRDLTQAWVAIPSVSTDPAHKKDCEEAARWLAGVLEESGGSVRVMEGYGNPLIVARVDVGAPTTFVVYGHYDVQPAAREEGWDSDPFELTERDGRFWARGVMDNKGQVAIHLAAVLALKEAGELRHNVVFFIEGDEESGSPHLEEAIRALRDELRYDAIVVSDGIREHNLPTLEMSFRGGFNLHLTIQTLAADQHSGMMARIVPNAPEVLVSLLVRAFDEKDGVWTLLREDTPAYDPAIDADLAALPFSQDALRRTTGAAVVYPQTPQEYGKMVGLEPAAALTTLKAGYLGEGFRNALAARAEAKINVRLAPTQDPHLVAGRVEEWFRDLCNATPEIVAHEVRIDTPYRGVLLPRDNPWLSRAARVWEEVAGRAPVRTYCGGGIPVVTAFHEIVGVPLVVTPLASEGSNIHAANENLQKDVLLEGLHWSARWFGEGEGE